MVFGLIDSLFGERWHCRECLLRCKSWLDPVNTWLVIALAILGVIVAFHLAPRKLRRVIEALMAILAVFVAASTQWLVPSISDRISELERNSSRREMAEVKARQSIRTLTDEQRKC